MVRRKQRYLLAEIIYPNNNMSYDLPVGDVHNAVKGAFEEQFGEYGMALVKSSLSVKFLNPNTKMLLIRIRRGAEGMLSNALFTMRSINGVNLTLVTRHVSGSIRCAQKYWIHHLRRSLHLLLQGTEDPVKRTQLLRQIKEVQAKTDISELFTYKRRPKPKSSGNTDS